LLEGPEIEPLLEQIREEYGASARIVSADKVRSGGLGGFFARQRYEVSVEVGEEAKAGLSGLSGGPGLPGLVRSGSDGDPSLPALLELVEASQDRLRRLSTSSEDVARTPLAEPASSAASGEDLPTRALVRGGQVSTVGTAFAEVMAGLQDGVGGFALSAPAAAVQPFRPQTIDRADVEAQGRVIIQPAGVDGPFTAALIDAGMPESIARRARAEDAYGAVCDALSALPGTPTAPSEPGDVLVIVGELAHALSVAREAAAMLRLDPSRILLAGPTTAGTGLHHSRRISGPAEAHRRARTLHRAEVPHVVVVDAPVHATDDGWARSICDALGATAVWAVADATRKTSETRRHLTAIGAVDALAVHGATGCADPASVLTLDVPVALLDSAPATSHTWAALLAPLLSESESTSEGVA
jgi:hypothetical protein